LGYELARYPSDLEIGDPIEVEERGPVYRACCPKASLGGIRL